MCLSVQIFFKVVVHILKACVHSICGNLTYPITFACILPSVIGPVMLVTSNIVGNALLSICRSKTHHPRLCTDCLLHASICTLGGFRVVIIPVQIVAGPCGLVGHCSQLLCELDSSETVLPTIWSYVFCVFVVHVVNFGWNLEAFEWCLSLVICDIEMACVLTLDIVLRLLFCVYGFYLSLITLVNLWVHSTHFFKTSKSTTDIPLYFWCSALIPLLVWMTTTLFMASSLWAIHVVLPSWMGSSPIVKSATPEDSSSHEAGPILLLGILTNFVDLGTVTAVWRLWL